MLLSMVTAWPAKFAVRCSGAHWFLESRCDRPHAPTFERVELHAIEITRLPFAAAPPLAMPIGCRASEAPEEAAEVAP
jgi:hypothetical protein